MRRAQIDRWVQRFIAAYEISGLRPIISRFRCTYFGGRQRVVECGCALGAYVVAFDSAAPAGLGEWVTRFTRLTGLPRATANGIIHGFDWDPDDDPFDFTGCSKAYQDGVVIGQHVRAAMAQQEIR